MNETKIVKSKDSPILLERNLVEFMIQKLDELKFDELYYNITDSENKKSLQMSVIYCFQFFKCLEDRLEK